ncbi:MAG: 3-deoxy-D-manno-octulosonic acid kinase [Litorilituus sp.]|jgi:3-deoxy-D-manno-octulosonic acid kinase|nr:3-deoxy-D-manno-octulosonic acid kinase [Litorilituus sp.]
MIKILQQGNIYCQYDQNEIKDFSPVMLNADFWLQQNAVTGKAQGRGTTWFICYQSTKHWVLRHYYRGGLIGKLIHDSYWFSSQKNTRAAKEFALLGTMQQLGLPAPKPIAYRVKKQGVLYQADLLSSRIENAQDLVAILSKQTLTDNVWKKVGETIKRFHDNGIYHHDLNAHNILINSNHEVFVIDFDRGEIKANNNKSWQQANIARLQRSFLKEFNQLPTFHFNQDNWKSLLKGYSEQ